MNRMEIVLRVSALETRAKCKYDNWYSPHHFGIFQNLRRFQWNSLRITRLTMRHDMWSQIISTRIVRRFNYSSSLPNSLTPACSSHCNPIILNSLKNNKTKYAVYKIHFYILLLCVFFRNAVHWSSDVFAIYFSRIVYLSFYVIFLLLLFYIL